MTTRNPRLETVVTLRDEASRALKNMTATTRKFKQEIRAAGLALSAMGTAILGLGAVTVKMASSLEESMNAVRVVFKTGAQDIIDFGKTASTQVGLTQNDFQQMATLTGALLRDVGLSEAEVAAETINLAKRAADMASVFDTDVKDALFAINAAVRGETEPIRRFAGDVTDATLQTTALALGIDKAVTAMSEQEKRLLRIETIMEQTSDTQGDWLNTADSFANTLKRVTAQIKDQATIIGSILLPVAKQIIGRIGSVVTKVTEWAKENPELFATIVKITAALGVVLTVLGALLLVLPLVISGITAMGVVIGALLGPIGWVVLGVAAFAAAYATNFLGIRDITNEVVAFIVEKFDQWFFLMGPAGLIIKGILFLKDNWRELTDVLTSAIETAVNAVMGKLRDLISVLAEVARFLNLDMAESLDGLVEKLGDVEFATDKVIDGIRDDLLDELKKMAETVKIGASEFDALVEAQEAEAQALKELKERLAKERAEAAKATKAMVEGAEASEDWENRFKDLENEVVTFTGTFAARTKQIIHDRDQAFTPEALTPFAELLDEFPGLLDAFNRGIIDAATAATFLAANAGLVNEALIEQVSQVTTLKDKWEEFIRISKGADQFSGAIAGQFNLGPPDTLTGPRGGQRRQGQVGEALARQRRAGTPGFDERGNPVQPPSNTESPGPRISITLSESLDSGMGKMVSE